MNWDDLRTLLAVSRAGTMQAAGRALGVSHTTVGRRIEALESATQTRLLRRLDRRWILTEAGQALVDAAGRLEDELVSIDRAWLSADEQLSGVLRVTTVDIVALLYADAFADFCMRCPQVELTLSTNSSMLSLSRDADVAIRLTTSPPEHLVGRRIGHWPYGLFAAESLLARHPGWTIEDLPWIGWQQHLGAHVTENWFRKHAPKAPLPARVDSPIIFQALLARGAGIGFTALPIGEHTPGLRLLQPAPATFTIDVWLLTHPELRNTRRVRALMDALADATPSWSCNVS